MHISWVRIFFALVRTFFRVKNLSRIFFFVFFPSPSLFKYLIVGSLIWGQAASKKIGMSHLKHLITVLKSIIVYYKVFTEYYNLYSKPTPTPYKEIMLFQCIFCIYEFKYDGSFLTPSPLTTATQIWQVMKGLYRQESKFSIWCCSDFTREISLTKNFM